MDFMAICVTVAVTVICVFTKGLVSTALAGLALSTVNGVSILLEGKLYLNLKLFDI